MLGRFYVIGTDGCFYGDGEFMTGLVPKVEDLEIPFAMEVFNMLKREGTWIYNGKGMASPWERWLGTVMTW